MRYFPINIKYETAEGCATRSDGEHNGCFAPFLQCAAALNGGKAAGGIVSPEGRCAPEGELMRGIFHPVTTGGWLTPIYCDSKENHSRELFQTANKPVMY